MRILAPLVSWTLLVASLAAGALLWLPLELAGPPQLVELAPFSFQANGGFSYLAPVETDIPSDRGKDHPDDPSYKSPLQLFEDGLELKPHAIHATIRDEGGGLFSHWGNRVFMAASDGSDPRTNGRSYQVFMSGSRESLSADARLAGNVLLFGAIAAFLLSLSCRRKGSPPILQVCSLAMVVVSGIGFSSMRSWWTMSDTLRTAERHQGLRELAAERHGPEALPVAHASTHPRTVRMFSDLGGIPFSTDTTAPPAREPREVPLMAEGAEAFQAGVLPCSAEQPLASASGLDISAEGVAQLLIRARVHQGSELKLTFETVKADGSTGESPWVLVPISPSSEWQSIEIRRPLERGTLMTAELSSGRTRLSRIVLSPGPGSGPLSLELAPLILSDPSVVYTGSTHGVEVKEFAKSARPALWQSVPGEFSMPWPAPAGRLIKGAVALLAGQQGSQVQYQVMVEDSAGQRTPVLQGAVGSAAGWLELRIELDADLASTARRLLLISDDLHSGAVLFWSGLRVIDTELAPRRVLLVLVDTLRADALASYGHPSNLTPSIDQLAEEGVRFDRCFSQAHWTRPSMPSIMTGHYVASTSVTDGSEHLNQAYVTLAESFASAGYHTVAIISNAHAGKANGLDQGFDEMLLDGGPPTTQQFLDTHAEPRLANLEEEDLFAWVHLMEVHGPYGPRTQPDGYVPPTRDNAEVLEPVERFDPPWHKQPTRAARIALYNSDLESLDRALGQFLDHRLALWERDGEPNTIVALASDHGELLGEYGKWGHMWTQMVPEAVHVPLIIRAPGQIDPGTVYAAPVENIDMGATLLDLAGVDVTSLNGPSRVGGHSLVPYVTGELAVPENALAISAVDPHHSGWGSFSVFSEEGGLVGLDGNLVGTLLDDSGMLGELPQGPSLADISFGVLPGFRAVWAEHLRTQAMVRRALLANASDEASTTTVDAESLEQMRALGYLGR